MGGVASFVGDVVGGAVGVVGGAIDFVGDALDDTWDIVTDAADWAVDTVSSTVQGALDDPIKTIAQIAAISTGQAYLLPAISAADAAASGGDIKDIAKAAAISYATTAAASAIAGQVGSGITVDDAGIPLLPVDAAYHAAAGVAGMTGSQAIGNAAAGSASNAFNAAVRGGDLDQVLKSAISGGVAGGTSTVLAEMGVPSYFMPVAGGAIAGGTSALLNGGDVFESIMKGAAIGGANSALNITGNKLKELYSENKEALANYFKSSEDHKKTVQEARAHYSQKYRAMSNVAEAQADVANGIATQFESERGEYERLLDQYENNKNLYSQTKDKQYADAANALVDDIEAAADKANETYAYFKREYDRYELINGQAQAHKVTYENLVAKVNQFKESAQSNLKKYEDTYGEYINESLVFNQELSEYTKDVLAQYVENTGEVPTPEKLKDYITSGKSVDEITQGIVESDLGQRWSDIQEQAGYTSKVMGSGLYDYKDDSESYLQKAQQAFEDRNSDLGMYYQYKALENEIQNNPNSIYARDEEGNIFDQTTGVTYLTPDTYQVDPEEWKMFQAGIRSEQSGVSDPVFAIANRVDRPEGTPGMGGQDQSGIDDPRNSMKIVSGYSFDDGTSLVTFEDGSTGIVDTDSGKIIRGDIEFSKSETPSNMYSESEYAKLLNRNEELPSWLDTWLQADSAGLQKETGFASSQGMTVSGQDTYKDATGNEYKKVTIGGKDYLQDIDNPTGLYEIGGGTPGETPGGTPGETPGGTPGETPGGTPGGTGPGGTPGGTGPGGPGGAGGTGGGNLAGALAAADYIAKNDTNKDGIVNLADSIAATAALNRLYQQGQRQQVTQKAVEQLTAVPTSSKAEPAKVVQGEQATLADVDAFSPEPTTPTTAATQPTGDLYFDESQVVNENPFGTPQQNTAQQQQQPGQNLFFDESQIRMAAEGGQIEHNPQFFSEGGLGTLDNRYVKGEGDGTSDSVPAMLASGEFVIPADVVSGLGNGDNDAGAAVLDEFMKAIRAHKRAADPSELPEDSKGPLAYLQEAMKKVRA